MREQTFRSKLKEIKWIKCKNYNLPSMPMAQGILIKHLIEHYKIPFHEVGYTLDIVGIRTKRQTMLWKDTGIGARFLGMHTHETDKVYTPESHERKQTQVFNGMSELNKEVSKRKYKKIKGLKTTITEEKYMEWLEMLPPMMWKDSSFIFSEALSDNLYYKFSKNPYQCEVVELEDEQVMRMEEAR